MKLTYFLYCFLIVASSANIRSAKTTETIRLETTQQKFTAGETVVLTFSGSQDATIKLYCANSYGTTLVTATVKMNNYTTHFQAKFLVKEVSLIGNC